jgi:hypothetical protein
LTPGYQGYSGVSLNAPNNTPVYLSTSLPINMDAAALAASNGVVHLDIPFTFGQPLYFWCGLSLRTGWSGYGGDPNGPVESQQSHLQVQWQGATVLDANSNVVSNFTLTSLSGTDWTASQLVVPGLLQITGVNVLSGTNLVITGTGGSSSNLVYLLTSTNITLPITNWVPLNTNVFDYVGHVNITNAITPGEPQRYFRLQAE